MDGSTALAVLGLEPGATKQQIKTTFRALAKGAHPDAFGVVVDDTNLTEAFVTLRTAYERALRDAPDGPMPAAHSFVAAEEVRVGSVSVGSVSVGSVSVGSVSVGSVSVGSVDTKSMSEPRLVGCRPAVAASFQANRPIVPAPDRGNWFTSFGPAGHIDVTDVSVVAARSLRADVVGRSRRSMDPGEQLFASLLADELAAA